jgi:hypothetical protein
VTFTRLPGSRYGVDVMRASGPPARLRVMKRDAEWLPGEIAHFLVEREFGLKLGMFGQLAAGGDAGRFWAAPADRDSRSANRSHRLQVTGRGDLGRSVALVAWCTAAWEIETGRRLAGQRLAGWADGSWPLLDVAAIPCEQVAGAVRCLSSAAVAWNQLSPRQQVSFVWPLALTLPSRRSA